ncbi:MAG: DUF5106 domain-containing protein [Mangrovibacterium sp.]
MTPAIIHFRNIPMIIFPDRMISFFSFFKLMRKACVRMALKVQRIFPFFLVLLVVACNGGDKQSAHSPKRTFTVPEIPLTFNTAELCSEYLMTHYWDNYDFSDSTLLGVPEYSEQAFAAFVSMLENVSLETAGKGVNKLMETSFKYQNAYQYFTGLAEKYLYDPNSPVRNESVFGLFLKARLDNPELDEIHKWRARKQWELICKNTPGSVAANFRFALANGSEKQMKSVGASLLLLYFHNPDCHECKVVKEKMLSSPIFLKAVSERTLTVLALYPDEDLSAYRQFKNEFPSEWIYAYDKGCVIKKKELYDLKAIPTLYLLDKNKIVLLKDVTFEMLESYLTDQI